LTLSAPTMSSLSSIDGPNYHSRETWSWDVRTKHVTYEPVPTVSGVHGLACYGPTAALFTLGPNHTVQQYDLENPQLAANVQHLPLGVVAPPTPPEESKLRAIEAPLVMPRRDSSESRSRKSDAAATSSIQKTTLEMNAAETARLARAVDLSSPLSSAKSATTSTSSRSSAAGAGPRLNNYSPSARTGYTGTTFSMGSPQDSRNTYISANSYASPSTGSITSSRSHRKGSRLRQEVLPSPEDKPLQELFPYTRARLHDVPYTQAKVLDETQLTPENLRRQMLEVVFGWQHDIEDLIRDERELTLLLWKPCRC
jgi:hypothetical protein